MKWSRNQIISLYEAEDNCVIKVFMTQLSFTTHSLPSMTPHWLCKFTSHFLSDAFKCPMLAAGESQQVYASRCISFWLFRSLRLLDQRLWWMSSHPALRDQASQIAISTQISSGQAPVLHSEPHLVCKCKGNTKQTFQSTAIWRAGASLRICKKKHDRLEFYAQTQTSCHSEQASVWWAGRVNDGFYSSLIVKYNRLSRSIFFNCRLKYNTGKIFSLF